ncbi:hypothetical protein D3C75_1227580 [compost metagenome]
MATSSSQPLSSLRMERASSMSLVLAPSMVKKGTWVRSRRGSSSSSMTFHSGRSAGSIWARLWRASTTHQGTL